MLFHTGALWRLNELGYLGRLDFVASVSGGAITAGVFGLAFRDLVFDDAGCATNFSDGVVAPIRALAGRTIDVPALALGPVLPGSTGNRLARAYRKHLFGAAVLADLPSKPAVAMYATNVRTGALVMFSRQYIGDWSSGLVPSPDIPLAVAVAASSAFPPFLSPIVLDVELKFAQGLVLMDGGVFDNLALNDAWRWYTTVLISDGGGRVKVTPHPRKNWVSQALRALQLISPQAPGVRARQAIEAFGHGTRDRCYWSAAGSLDAYTDMDTLPCPRQAISVLAGLTTRLGRTPARTQDRLINWGYAACDAAMRRRLVADAPRGTFPYPGAGVG
jgi:NTE family protein